MNGRWVRCVGVFCIAILVVSGAYADKPEKKPKPDKPGETKAECIVFSGDLQSAGDTEIVGCCPNAGPWPAYTMTLTIGSALDGTHEGYLFINVFGTGPNAQYKVQFWTWNVDTETPTTGDYFFEIIGGEIIRDRKAKTLTVEFTNEMATGWIYSDVNPTLEIPIPNVSFVLFRTGKLEYCE